ncbi:MAG: hypothetical protein RLY31_1408 [Bacteroidota bacterium]
MKHHLPVFSLFLASFFLASCDRPAPRVLVFSKTMGFRHESIGAGKLALLALGVGHGFQVDTTENDSAFYEENLRQYDAVVFLNTTGDVLNLEQQNHFERYIQAGGGYVGIHAATDTEYDWPWYGKLAGAYFKDHPGNPNVQEGEYFVVDRNHPACDSLPDRFRRADEFYNFKQMNPAVKPLVNIDESTYREGNMGEHHPMSWYHEYDGGRAFYTAMGHTVESFAEPLFLHHLWGGLKWVLDDGRPQPLDYGKVRTKRMPEENRFSREVLEEKLNEPIELAVLPGGNILFIERYGAVKLFDLAEGRSMVVDTIPVSTKYTDADGRQSEAEDGLLGVALDPDFERNHFIYFYCSPAGDKPVNALLRYELVDEKLVRESRKVILEVPVQREQCCHTGGSIAFDAQGNLYVSTGDNTSPRGFNYGPTDERPGRSPWDAQKSSGNTNDLRGKILRIHPEPDGSYTIPEGNLFPPGTEGTRPEIYVMGTRNPYRISVDARTGFLYWGEVGPDARRDSVPFGPMGYDEVNQARQAGNFGWPYFVGDNRAYVRHDFAAGASGSAYDPLAPVNRSPNNTGRAELPPARPAFIWYPYGPSPEFPLVGSGGRNAMAGPVFHAADFKGSTRAFPDYFDGKLFIYDWMRGWIMAVTMDDQGNYVSMEPFMGGHKFSNPVDMAFSPDGDLYVLEYGTAWFQGNPDARLLRISYTAGNRPPQAAIAADRTVGAVPLAVHLDARGTLDYDGDPLSYRWVVRSADGGTVHQSEGVECPYTLTEPGVYQFELTVADGQGGTGTATAEISVGNEPPAVSMRITDGNQRFFLSGQPFAYAAAVVDREDGSTDAGVIPADAVSVTIDYLAEGFDKAIVAQGHKTADDLSQYAAGKRLMEKSDCYSCHQLDRKSVGPTFLDISTRYRRDPAAVGYLQRKIKEGGVGVWGEVAMAAHPALPDADVVMMARYILGLTQRPDNALPLAGAYTPVIPEGEGDQGVFLLRAAYTDRGANGMPGIRREEVLVLRNANLSAAACDESRDMMKFKMPGGSSELMIAQEEGAYLLFRDVDLTGIGRIGFLANAPANFGMQGGKVEVRLGAPDGPLLGTSGLITAAAMDPAAPPRPNLVTAVLTPQEGLHDVYLVCRKADPAAQGLFVLLQVMFQGAGGSI